MNRIGKHAACATAMMSGLLLVSTAAGAADTAEVDNPIYTFWSHFQPGSSETFDEAVTNARGQVHHTVTQTLDAIDADSVTLATTTERPNGAKPFSKTLKQSAKVPPPMAAEYPSTKVGEEDVKIGDATYHCVVYASDPATSQPGLVALSKTQKLWLCDTVPGQLVKRHIDMQLRDQHFVTDDTLVSCQAK